jgi:flavin-dependent thymidylate synthase
MQNKVELIGWYGGDRAIARAAWTSTQIDVDKKTDEQVRDLIVNKLWNNGTGKAHKTPFERGIVEFNITCCVASHIHIIKHRLLNVNGESARYKELKEDKYYLPEDWDGILETKPEHWKVFNHDINGNEFPFVAKEWVKKLEQYTKLGNDLYHRCLEDLTPVLGRKRAKESARYFKTYNSQITLSVMSNMSCFENFLKLRMDEAAQLEIREIAVKMLECVKNIEGNPFKYTLEAWGY